MSGDFTAFPKIPRWFNGRWVFTEKIDGSNAQIQIVQISSTTLAAIDSMEKTDYTLVHTPTDDEQYAIRAGSRKRWIGEASGDNFGFAAWVRENAEGLIQLGTGTHFGEWYGSGIQRGYGLTEKRFALFNVSKWLDSHEDDEESIEWVRSRFPKAIPAPSCCRVVPIIGVFDHNGDMGDIETISEAVDWADFALRLNGTRIKDAVDTKPEGVVLFNEASHHYYKHLFDSPGPKGESK